MKFNSKNSFKSLDNISSSGQKYKIFNLKKAEQNGLSGISKLPKSLKVLLENLLRFEDDLTVNKKQILAIYRNSKELDLLCELGVDFPIASVDTSHLIKKLSQESEYYFKIKK